jgi:hypothetical protein
MTMHVDFSCCTGKFPLFQHRYVSKQKSTTPYTDLHGILHTMSEADTKQFLDSGTHHPIAFIDHETTQPLPDAAFLAQFRIVLTSQQRLTYEFPNVSLENKINVRGRYQYNEGLPRKVRKVCPLLEVYWLRLIVDEGHVMGKGSHSGAIQVVSWIHAQRRWAMTGTPTSQKNCQVSLKGVFGLMNFLQH